MGTAHNFHVLLGSHIRIFCNYSTMCKRERRSQVQRYIHTVTENTNKKHNMLGNFKAKVSKLNNRCILL
jgi:hypothetical protein